MFNDYIEAYYVQTIYKRSILECLQNTLARLVLEVQGRDLPF